MWISLLAFLTVGLVSLHKCQRHPGPVLGMSRLLAVVVPGLGQRRKFLLPIPNRIMFSSPFFPLLYLPVHT